MKWFVSILAIAAVLVPAGRSAQAPALRPQASPHAPRSQLRRAVTTHGFGTQFTRLQQSVAGVPVLGAEAVVTDAPGARADLLIDHTYAGLRAPGRPAFSREQAIRTAERAVRAVTFRGAPSASLAILPRRHGVLVWRVVVPLRVPLGSFEVLVDARTKRVLRIRDLLRHADGQARIFDPNPVEEQGSTAGLADNNDADSPALTNLRVLRPLQRLSSLDTCLDGQWVKAVLPAGDADASDPAGDVCAPGRDFTSITRSNDQFEALMAYFHIDRAQAYMQSLGFTNVVNRQLQVNVDDSSPFPPGEEDNSFFDPATGQITLGPGGIDDGEDADVITHEYGHAIQDALVCPGHIACAGFGDGQEAGAIGEGFADYIAADISATFTPNGAADACIAEWDIFELDPTQGCLRRVDLNPTVAQMIDPPCSGEIHCLGQAYSGALWTIRGTLGEPAADKLIFQSQRSLTSNASFQDASMALLAADMSLNGGANQTFLRNLLPSRGLLDLEHIDDSTNTIVSISVPGQATGDINSATDPHDVYKVGLTAHQGLVVHSTSAANVDLRLYAPGSNSLYSGTVVAGATTPGTGNESFSYIAPTSGTYYLDVSTLTEAGTYTIETVNDADGDGLVDASDNCPGIANRSQSDWNKNGKGDACDPAAQVTIKSVSVRKHTVSFRAQARPADVSGWRLLIQRRSCNPRCHFGATRSAAGTRKVAAGQMQLAFRLPLSGLYRLQAVLTDPRYDKAKSRFVTVRIAGKTKKAPKPTRRRRS